MLEHLSVRDFALIDEAEVDFSEGLVLFTGETGAGKSLVVGALGFLFGGRGDSGIIRDGADECSVAATLDISGNGGAKEWLASHDIPDEEGRLTLRRGLKGNGRSYAYIQNRAVSRADLAEFTARVADIHGQHEHQSLLARESHRVFLDSFASLESDLQSYRASYEKWTAAAREYRKRTAEAERREQQQELLAFAVNEIRAAKIKPAEDDDLQREEKMLSQHEKLFAAVNGASESLSLRAGEASGVVGNMRKAKNELDVAKGIDPALAELSSRLDSAYFEVEDIAESLSAYIEGLKFDPDRLEEVETRLAELKRLMKKYGPGLDDVIARAEKDAAALDSFASWKDDKAELERTIAALRKETIEKAEKLSADRTAAAAEFSKEVEAILSRLGMPQASLPVCIEPMKSETGKLLLTSEGMDEVEFLIAPNLGEAPRPLAKIASGGELSRVALAIKAVLSSKDTVDTLIFDEIDTGIGGEVAVDVGTYLKGISRFRQVLCVTHLATIAARADLHYRVDKKAENGRTVTRITALAGSEREEEIARMLAGDKEGAASLAHATELLRRFSSAS